MSKENEVIDLGCVEYHGYRWLHTHPDYKTRLDVLERKVNFLIQQVDILSERADEDKAHK